MPLALVLKTRGHHKGGIYHCGAMIGAAGGGEGPYVLEPIGNEGGALVLETNGSVDCRVPGLHCLLVVVRVAVDHEAVVPESQV